METDAFAIVYASQGAPALRELIELRSVPALPLGGRFRAIDFLLSNVTNSGIRSVGLITQRNYKSLMDHIGSGKDWDLSRKNGGLMVLPPYDLGTASGIYRGVCDALFAKRDFIDHQRQRLCLLLEGSYVYRQDYARMVEAHMASGADVTLLYHRWAGAAGTDPYGRMTLDVDGSGRVRGMDYQALAPASDLVGLGACLIDRDLLVRLVEDACAEGRYSFVRDVLAPAVRDLRVAGYEHRGYAARLTSVKSYFDTNMDMADPAACGDLFSGAPVYTKVRDSIPVRFAATSEVEDSVFGNGGDIRGRVVGSVVFRGVEVGEGADLARCIVMQGSRIGRGCHLRNVIVDKDCVIGDGARLVATPDDPLVVRKGSVVEGALRG